MFQLSTICRKESGSKIFTFSYDLTTLVRKKFIGSCSLRSRQMAAHSYHSVPRHKAYKTIPSLLLSRPSRGRHTSLAPTLPRPSSVQNDLRRLKFRFAGTGNGKQKLNLSSFGGPITEWVGKPTKSTFVPGRNFLYRTKLERPSVTRAEHTGMRPIAATG